ncbi:hypothetical protein EAF00_011813 [Botryotinia globosa]|nr:hypothetical protein EAF00_011813 [Botryotinia globosa]
MSGKILDLIFENWNERFATLKQEYKRKGKAAMEIRMIVGRAARSYVQTQGGDSDGQIEIEQGGEEDGNVYGDAIARPASNSMRSAAIVPTTQNSRNSNIPSNVRPTPRIIQKNSNMHNGAIAPPNQRPANNQNLSPGRTHQYSSSTRTTQNPPVSTTAGSSANFNQASHSERWQCEQDRLHRGHRESYQQQLSRRSRKSREYESSRGGARDQEIVVRSKLVRLSSALDGKIWLANLYNEDLEG